MRHQNACRNITHIHKRQFRYVIRQRYKLSQRFCKTLHTKPGYGKKKKINLVIIQPGTKIGGAQGRMNAKACIPFTLWFLYLVSQSNIQNVLEVSFIKILSISVSFGITRIRASFLFFREMNGRNVHQLQCPRFHLIYNKW